MREHSAEAAFASHGLVAGLSGQTVATSIQLRNPRASEPAESNPATSPFLEVSTNATRLAVDPSDDDDLLPASKNYRDSVRRLCAPKKLASAAFRRRLGREIGIVDREWTIADQARHHHIGA
jgi:hypothetical protein